MAISLNNHESRIKTLESSHNTLSITKVSSNSHGNCYSYGNLFIQSGWFNCNGALNVTISFSKQFNAVIGFVTSSNHRYLTVTNSSATIQDTNWGGRNADTISWIAIGYLISDRILKYAYACKSLLFTPLRTIGGVK